MKHHNIKQTTPSLDDQINQTNKQTNRIVGLQSNKQTNRMCVFNQTNKRINKQTPEMWVPNQTNKQTNKQDYVKSRSLEMLIFNHTNKQINKQTST